MSLFVRLFMCVGFGLGCLGFLVGALYAINELRRGRIARRDVQQMMVVISAGFVLLLVCAYMVYWDMLELSVASAIKARFALLVYWIMAVGIVLLSTIRWQREDVLLEQKRTQLEIALLREAMSKWTLDSLGSLLGAARPLQSALTASVVLILTLSLLRMNVERFIERGAATIDKTGLN